MERSDDYGIDHTYHPGLLGYSMFPVFNREEATARAHHG